eukprot:571860-Pyramimonas_sp.AAC.1
MLRVACAMWSFLCRGHLKSSKCEIGWADGLPGGNSRNDSMYGTSILFAIVRLLTLGRSNEWRNGPKQRGSSSFYPASIDPPQL